MENLEVNWGDVIRAASENPLGIVALVVLVLAAVAVIFFRGAGNGVKLAVFGSLLLSGCGLVAVAFHERTDLEDTVKRAKDLSALAASIDHQLTEIDQPDSGTGGPRAGGLLAQTAILSDAVAALPALRQSPAAQSAQLRLADKRAAMLPRKDPKTGEVKPGSQPLDADTKQAAHDLSRSVAESLKGKDPLELRELLKTVPGG